MNLQQCCAAICHLQVERRNTVQRPTAYDETDQRPSVYDETDQGATYDEFDIVFGSRPNGVNRDGGTHEAFGNLQGHGWQAPAEAIENEALSYSLGNSLGNEYVMDGGIQIN